MRVMGFNAEPNCESGRFLTLNNENAYFSYTSNSLPHEIVVKVKKKKYIQKVTIYYKHLHSWHYNPDNIVEYMH